jgi:hypothetical protein
LIFTKNVQTELHSHFSSKPNSCKNISPNLDMEKQSKQTSHQWILQLLKKFAGEIECVICDL